MFIEGSSNGLLNNVTPVTIVGAPTIGRRIVKLIIIYNADTIPHNISIILKNTSGDNCFIWKGILQSGDTFIFGENEIIVLDTANKTIEVTLGEIKTTNDLTYGTTYGDAL